MTVAGCTVTNYAELVKAIRDRVDELGTTYASVDAAAGLQENYFAKLVMPLPPRRMCAFTTFLILQALGLKVILTEDAEALKRSHARLAKRQFRKPSVMRAAPRIQFGPDQLDQMRSRGGFNRAARMTSAERSASARHAAQARWSRRARGSSQMPSI